MGECGSKLFSQIRIIINILQLTKPLHAVGAHQVQIQRRTAHIGGHEVRGDVFFCFVGVGGCQRRDSKRVIRALNYASRFHTGKRGGGGGSHPGYNWGSLPPPLSGTWHFVKIARDSPIFTRPNWDPRQKLSCHWGHWSMFCHRTLMENHGKRDKFSTILLCITYVKNVHFFLPEHDRNHHI